MSEECWENINIFLPPVYIKNIEVLDITKLLVCLIVWLKKNYFQPLLYQKLKQKKTKSLV